MFQSYTLNKQFTLVRNPHWNAATDPQVRQLPDKIVFNLNLNANDIDNRLLAGDLDVDQAGTGVQTAARAKILSSPTLKQNADDALSGFLWFAYINTKVPPLNNVACRRAVEYAATSTPCRPLMAARSSARHRHHGDAADDRRLPELRPVQGADPAVWATSPTRRHSSRSAVTRAASPPTSPTGPTGPRKYSPPRPLSRPCPRSASRPICRAICPVSTTPTSLARPPSSTPTTWAWPSVVGSGLAGRLRLPRRDLERQRDRDLRWQHQHRGAERPGRQLRLCEGREPAGRGPAERDLDPDRPPDHGRRGNPACACTQRRCSTGRRT